MDEDAEQLSGRDRARLLGRARKIERGRMVVDNPGLRALALILARRRGERSALKAAPDSVPKRPPAPGPGPR
ncbi:MAG TPA: hypothetical protein VNI34_00900 [Candidatus Nitrosotalea sp.]|nr:hypothetical protein [Candidatus Nitrosotalea sp.]